jgi:hypothetical protein
LWVPKNMQVSSKHHTKPVDKIDFSPPNCGFPLPLMYWRGWGGWMWCRLEVAVVVDGATRMYVVDARWVTCESQNHYLISQ